MKELSRAAIIAVGSELLTPNRVDTNSLHITERLNLLGIDVVAKSVAGDARDDLEWAVRSALPRVDLLVCCGGLGPTDDDVTREVVARVLGRPMTEDLEITERMRARFAARGFSTPMPEINRRQAMVPEGARVLENTRGSAPGLWLEDGERAVLLLPGPPRELEPMLATVMDTLLRDRAAGVPLVRRVLKIAGRIESQTDELLRPLYEGWGRAAVPIHATILASLGQIELHLSARAGTRDASGAALDAAVEQVAAVLGRDIFSTDGQELEAVGGRLLVDRGLRVGVAESCTGGLIASRLTDVPGSSAYVERAVVTYSNDSKTELLGVPAALLAEHGAVSEPVAIAMAEGIRGRAPVEIGIGVTGVAGPGGGSASKPVGTVAIAVVTPDSGRSRVFRFAGERGQVKYQASQAALDMLRRMLE